ncbi:MAG: hypothetical protein WCF98_13015 [Synechococcus sp. ELA057]|jgi:hypothetical protein
MREIVFQVRPALEGQWMGRCLDPALQICAPTLEELHHEARDALIERLGPSHVACRIRLDRPSRDAVNAPEPHWGMVFAGPACC